MGARRQQPLLLGVAEELPGRVSGQAGEGTGQPPG